MSAIARYVWPAGHQREKPCPRCGVRLRRVPSEKLEAWLDTRTVKMTTAGGTARVHDSSLCGVDAKAIPREDRGNWTPS